MRAGDDRFDENLMLGGTDAVDCKVSAADTGGAFSIFWSETVGRRGPSWHLHPDQDEWFFVQQSTFRFKVGDDEFTLGPGDSVLAPRGLPHTWANVGDEPGRMVITFQPAGKMEDFFRTVTRLPADRRLTREEAEAMFVAHGMRLLGPGLKVD